MTYHEMRTNCTVQNGRLCYFDEICPQGGPNKAPVGGKQASSNMWAPIQVSLVDPSPSWVQIGTNADGMCATHPAYRRRSLNKEESWMVTNEDVAHKRIYACCPLGE